MLRWRIYYVDGSTFSYRDGTPYEAPRSGVGVIAQESTNARGWQIDFKNIYGKDFFVYDEAWYCCDLAGLILYIIRRKGPLQILIGQMSPIDADFEDIKKRAGNEGFDG